MNKTWKYETLRVRRDHAGAVHLERTTTPESEEALGPVDLGPEQEWTHFLDEVGEIAFCGNDCTNDRELSGPRLSGERACPDCLRLNGGRWL